MARVGNEILREGVSMSDEERLEAIADTISLTWGIHPDTAMSNFDAWRRNGYTPDQIVAAVQAAVDKQPHTPLTKPFGWIGKRLSDSGPAKPNVFGVLKRMGSVDPPTQETYTPREPAGHIWRRTDHACAPCNEIKRGAKPSHVIAMAHSCGEATPLAPILKEESDKRREEAAFFGECKRCRGGGFVWAYDEKRNAVVTSRGVASFMDTRGVRYIVSCGCR
ncbi:MAG TPA: hypothetical protein VJP78_12165 [Thermoleophilia bacterium]|nr:hypothetical protein [Thermoleophilia bacterium]